MHEDKLTEVFRQARSASRRLPLVPTLTAAPTDTSTPGTQWANTTSNTVSVSTGASVLTLSPVCAGRYRSMPFYALPQGEGAANIFDIPITIPRTSYLRTFVELYVEPIVNTGTANVYTTNAGWCKQQLRQYSPANIIEADPLYRQSSVHDDGQGFFMGSVFSLHRLWTPKITGPTTNYFLRLMTWMYKNIPKVELVSIDIQYDFVDTVL